jgi:hypothetical protein
MASPDQYRRNAEFRASTAAGVVVIDNDTGRASRSPAPMRQGSPEEDDALPITDAMISRSDATWLPSSWLTAVQSNEDPMLLKGGDGLKLYDSLLSDETAMSTLQQRRLAITSKEYEVVPGDDADPRSVKAADDFRAMIDALGFDRVTGMLHFGVWYGYAIGEGLYVMKQHDGRVIVWLADIVVPDRRHFGFTREGELRFVGEVTSSLTGERLPPNKFVTIRTGGTHDFAFYGLGLAHWCYWPIFFKRSAIKFWALYLEKLGRPTVGIGFGAEEATDKVKKAELLSAAVAIGQDSAVLLPEAYMLENKVKIFESARSGNNVQGYKDFVTENNEAIMRVVLGQPGTSKGVSAGLNSDQASEHAGVKEEIVKADSDLISDAIGTFAKWVTRWNHGEDVKPPITRRILKAGEDLSEVAKRDATLDGIGIKRSEDSIKATYGDGYEVDRETTEERNAREAAALAMKTGAAPAGPAAPLNKAEAGRKRIAEFAAQGGETAFSPLYVSRAVAPSTAAKLVAWAKKQGIDPVPASELHSTVLYSKTAVDWFEMAGEGWDSEELRVQAGGPRFVERFGDDAIVLRFDSPVLRYRNAAMMEKGATSDHADYRPHITIGKGQPDLDLAAIEPFVDELKFGPEIFEPIKEDAPKPPVVVFSAAEESAIDRLIGAATMKGSEFVGRLAEAFSGALEGITQPEAGRIAILEVVEKMNNEDWAREFGAVLAAERGAALVGADEEVDA